MEDVNWFGIAAGAISAFVVGGLWYSPLLFGKSWMKLAGVTQETLDGANPALMYGLGFVLSLLAALVFAMFIGSSPSLPFAAGAGFSAGLCWVGTSFGINYLFEQKPFRLFAINAGYHTLQFTLYGVCLAVL